MCIRDSYSAIPTPFMAITCGVSAVGKSQVALRLVEALGAIRLRSDVERKRLFGEQPDAAKGSLNSGIYSADASVATYQRLHQLAERALHAGFPVVLDAAYLKREQRGAAWQVAEQNGTPFLILDCQAPQDVIAAWLQQRQAEGNDPSDATLEVIAAQQASRDALDDDEQAHSRRVDTHQAASLDGLIESIRQRLPGL